jgi:hypothetical protein
MVVYILLGKLKNIATYFHKKKIVMYFLSMPTLQSHTLIYLESLRSFLNEYYVFSNISPHPYPHMFSLIFIPTPFWEHAYFEKEDYFGHRPIFGEKVYFEKDLILERRPNFGVRAIDGKKEACQKRRKRSMQEEKQCGAQTVKPNHDRVRVLDNHCNEYELMK